MNNAVFNKIMEFAPTIIALILSILIPIGFSGSSNSSSNNNSSTNNSATSESFNKKDIYATINQGDKLDNNGCTIAYIDMDRMRAYSAAHCKHEKGEQAWSNGKNIGVFGRGETIQSLDNNGLDGVVDTVEINLYDNVEGNNSFSGNNVVKFNDINIGDKVCFMGRATIKPYCDGEVKSFSGKARVISHGDYNSIPGDSGGPAWIPGKGFIGIVTAGGKGDTYIDIMDNSYNVFTWN